MQPEVEDTVSAADPDAELQAVDQEDARPITEQEKRLRREVARYREQARIAQSERDAACAAAARERDEAIAAAKEDAHGRVLRAELRGAALRAGILDLDALRLADTDGVSMDEDGELRGVDEAIASLKQHKPYLFGSAGSDAAAVTTTQLQRPPVPARPATVDARSLSREAWRAERERLLSGSR